MNNKQTELLQLIATINRQVDFTADISIYIKGENNDLTTIELIELINKTTEKTLTLKLSLTYAYINKARKIR
jgi:hypothetical protein